MKLALPALILAATVYASDCNPGQNNYGLSVENFQTAAWYICNGRKNDLNLYIKSSGGNPNRLISIHVGYNGSAAKGQCWNAFNNIIGQCIEGSGRDGGWWKWSYNGDVENYTMQAYLG